jgi:unspecific monooxygenase
MLTAVRGNMLEAFTTRLFVADHVRRLFGTFFVHFIMTAEAIRYIFRDSSESFMRHSAFLRMGHRIRGDGILSSEGPTWTRQRRILSPAFGRALFSRHHPRANAVNDALCRTVQTQIRSGQPVVDIWPLSRRWSMTQVTKLVFSDDADADLDELLRLTQGATDILYGDTASIVGIPSAIPTPVRIKGSRLRRRFDAISRKLLEKRRSANERPADVLDYMLHQRDKVTGAGLSEQEVLNNIVTFFLAGIDTSALSLTYTLYCVALSDGVQRRIIDEVEGVIGNKAHPDFDDFEEMAYTRAVVDEGLRFYPAVPLHVRMATANEDTPFGPVRKGDAVCVPSWVTHFREDLWDDPETFKPERFLAPGAGGPGQAGYMPFGLGPHRCLGHLFAKRVLCLAVAAVVRRFRFDVPEDFALKLKATPVLQPVDGVRLRFCERSARTAPSAPAEPVTVPAARLLSG